MSLDGRVDLQPAETTTSWCVNLEHVTSLHLGLADMVQCFNPPIGAGPLEYEKALAEDAKQMAEALKLAKLKPE